MNFDDRVAIVTGAASGMGQQIAHDLLRAGARVALADIQSAAASEAAAGAALCFKGDVSDADFTRRVVDETLAAYGRLDYLVNCAGVLWFDRDESVVDMDMAVWDRVLNINLKGAALMCRFAIPAMRTAGNGGALVHIASIDALRGDARPQDAYGASKAALIRLSRSLAVQCASQGIRSNAILPGPVLSPMQQRWRDDPAALEAVGAAVPLGRVGTPRDIANACLFLLSGQASFITGTELIVDGGCTALP